ncbi:MAG: 1-acyl-sn-glycerol-3-phosphate acyltransferase [Deltaproteobacteria bacterium]|nr:MAG: 1-acyl-sn-glycerol-3-phosphate acyltransferase [Deltaproteobacteria bacterium]
MTPVLVVHIDFMIRTCFVWASIFVATLVLGPLTVIAYPLDPKGRLGHRIGKLWGKVALLANGVRVEVEGLEHLPKNRPCVFMSNHQGNYDIFSLLGHLPCQFKWLAKKELFSIPVLGWAMTAAGYISIDRAGTRETVEAMNKAARRIRDGMCVVIFPEGSRSPDGFIQDFKKGGFTLAIKSKVPIVPIAIAGSREIMPKDSLTLNPGTVRIRIGQPIGTEHCSMKDRNTLMEQVREAISSQFKRITGVTAKENSGFERNADREIG